jgi:hypothetical protein
VMKPEGQEVCLVDLEDPQTRLLISVNDGQGSACPAFGGK